MELAMEEVKDLEVVMVILEVEKFELIYLPNLEGQPTVVEDVLEDEDIVSEPEQEQKP